MLNRRDFVRLIATLSAGAAAMPEQIEAFARYYDRNTPNVDSGLMGVDRLTLGGIASVPTAVTVTLRRQGEPVWSSAMNAFGGIICWGALPDQKIIGTDITWEITPMQRNTDLDSFPLAGSISYIDQTGLRITKEITDWKGKIT